MAQPRQEGTSLVLEDHIDGTTVTLTYLECGDVEVMYDTGACVDGFVWFEGVSEETYRVFVDDYLKKSCEDRLRWAEVASFTDPDPGHETIDEVVDGVEHEFWWLRPYKVLRYWMDFERFERFDDIEALIWCQRQIDAKIKLCIGDVDVRVWNEILGRYKEVDQNELLKYVSKVKRELGPDWLPKSVLHSYVTVGVRDYEAQNAENYLTYIVTLLDYHEMKRTKKPVCLSVSGLVLRMSECEDGFCYSVDFKNKSVFKGRVIEGAGTTVNNVEVYERDSDGWVFKLRDLRDKFLRE